MLDGSLELLSTFDYRKQLFKFFGTKRKYWLVTTSLLAGSFGQSVRNFTRAGGPRFLCSSPGLVLNRRKRRKQRSRATPFPSVQFREREELRTRRFKVRGTRYLFRSADSTCGASNCLSSQSAFNRSRLNALWPCQDENQRNFLRARIDLETVLHLKTI